MKVDCPICNGSGKIEEPKNVPIELRKEQQRYAKSLRNNGYSIREIMRIMNYKSTRSVSILLDN